MEFILRNESCVSCEADSIIENNEWIERIKLAEAADAAVKEIFIISDAEVQTIQMKCGFLPGEILIASGYLEQELIARCTVKSERQWNISRDFLERDEADLIKRLLLSVLHSKTLYYTTTKSYLSMFGRAISSFRQAGGLKEGQLARHVIKSACRGASIVQALIPSKMVPSDWYPVISQLRSLDDLPFDEGEYQPIPDDLLIDLAHRFVFLGEKVIPRLTELLMLTRKKMAREGYRPGIHTDEYFKVVRLKAIQELGATGSFAWVDNNKNQLEPDFFLNFSEKRWSDSFDGLPDPRQITWQQTMDIYNLCKCSAWFFFKLVTGSRNSESSSILRNCLKTEFGQISAQGKTYKLEKGKGGANRDWPLPERVGHILESFIKLDGVARDLVNWRDTLGNELFRASIFYRKSEFWSSSGAMKFAMRKFGLDLNYPDDVVHDHRFRKTIARVLAIASEEGAELAFQLFGHKDIAMTLHYMTADPELQDAIIEAREECRKALGLEIVQNLEKFEGSTIERIKKDIGTLSKDDVKGMFASLRESTNSATKLAEIFFSKGDLPRMVNPGVICSKPRKGIPKCGNRGSDPNTLNCQGGCEHRVIRLDELSKARAILTHLFEQHRSAAASKGKQKRYEIHTIQKQIRAQVNDLPEIIAQCSPAEKVILEELGVACD